MDDLIQRQALLDALRARFGVDFDYGKWWSSTHVLAAIESVPGVKPEPCEDAISRKAAIDALKKHEIELPIYAPRETDVFWDDAIDCCISEIEALPPVKPQYTEAEIQKMQELEQAEIEKAYELGKAEQRKVGRWKEVYAETDYRNGWIEFSCENCEYQHGLESGEYGWIYGDPIPWKYCPICGARMREVDHESCD